MGKPPVPVERLWMRKKNLPQEWFSTKNFPTQPDKHLRRVSRLKPSIKKLGKIASARKRYIDALKKGVSPLKAFKRTVRTKRLYISRKNYDLHTGLVKSLLTPKVGQYDGFKPRKRGVFPALCDPSGQPVTGFDTGASQPERGTFLSTNLQITIAQHSNTTNVTETITWRGSGLIGLRIKVKEASNSSGIGFIINIRGSKVEVLALRYAEGRFNVSQEKMTLSEIEANLPAASDMYETYVDGFFRKQVFDNREQVNSEVLEKLTVAPYTVYPLAPPAVVEIGAREEKTVVVGAAVAVNPTGTKLPLARVEPRKRIDPLKLCRNEALVKQVEQLLTTADLAKQEPVVKLLEKIYNLFPEAKKVYDIRPYVDSANRKMIPNHRVNWNPLLQKLLEDKCTPFERNVDVVNAFLSRVCEAVLEYKIHDKYF